MTLRALLFDLDGTLADTEILGHRPAYNRAFRKLGLPFRWGPKLYRKLLRYTGGTERLLQYLEQHDPDLGGQRAAIQADPGAWARAVHALKSRYFLRLVRSGQVPLRPGVARLMQEAKAAGLRLAVVTSASRSTLTPVIRYSLGAAPVREFDVTVCGREVARKKPAPDLYLLALSRLGMSPGECIAIEDSQSGLVAASAAGVPVVVTPNANTLHEDFSGAQLVVDTLGEPDAPCTVLMGRLQGPCVTVAALRRVAATASKRAA